MVAQNAPIHTDVPTNGRRGRAKTGRTTASLTFRLTLERMVELRRRAEVARVSPSRFVTLLLLDELKPRPGQATRARLKKEQGPAA